MGSGGGEGFPYYRILVSPKFFLGPCITAFQQVPLPPSSKSPTFTT
jgi:hypothetical protein